MSDGPTYPLQLTEDDLVEVIASLRASAQYLDRKGRKKVAEVLRKIEAQAGVGE